MLLEQASENDGETPGPLLDTSDEGVSEHTDADETAAGIPVLAAAGTEQVAAGSGLTPDAPIHLHE